MKHLRLFKTSKEAVGGYSTPFVCTLKNKSTVIFANKDLFGDMVYIIDNGDDIEPKYSNILYYEDGTSLLLDKLPDGDEEYYSSIENYDLLTKAYIADTEVPFSAFGYAEKLKEVKFLSNVTTIGENAFGDCNSLETIDLPDSITVINDSAFYGCKALKSITIPPNVTSLGS